MSMASRCGYGRVSRQWILDPSVTPTSVMHMRGVPIAVISQRLGPRRSGVHDADLRARPGRRPAGGGDCSTVKDFVAGVLIPNRTWPWRPIFLLTHRLGYAIEILTESELYRPKRPSDA